MRPASIEPYDWIMQNSVWSDDDGCLEWQGYTTRFGHGQMSVNNVRQYVHRLVYEHRFGELGCLHVLHKCDNPRCVNIAHLFTGSQSDNVHDMHSKGRGATGSTLPQSKLTEGDVALARAIYENDPYRGAVTDLAEAFGIGQGTASVMLARKTWGHVQ